MKLYALLVTVSSIFIAGGIYVLTDSRMASASNDPRAPHVPIHYVNLSLEEEEHAAEILADIEPLYLTHISDITVTTNVDCPTSCTSNCTACGGSYKDGSIKVKYRDYWDEAFMATVCHEILHSLIETSRFTGSDWDAPNHKIISDIGNELVCFKSYDNNRYWSAQQTEWTP